MGENDYKLVHVASLCTRRFITNDADENQTCFQEREEFHFLIGTITCFHLSREEATLSVALTCNESSHTMTAD